MPLTIFTWGYYGWGNHTPDLIRAVDAVETGRGYRPPIFVDIRIRRSVRAVGFTGPAFERVLGPDRHRWMKALGNTYIETRSGPSIQIAEPEAAVDLLDLAIESAEHNQRLIFFCGCQWPKRHGEIACHRATVARLVLKAATARRIDLEVVEWPGGDPRQFEIEVASRDFAAAKKGRLSLPLDEPVPLAEFAGLPCASIATLVSGEEKLHRLVGPAISQSRGWALPILYGAIDPAAGLNEYRKESERLRKGWGLESDRAGA